MIGDKAKVCIITHAWMHRTAATAQACAFLLHGPAPFDASNLLADLATLPSNDHHRLHLTIGTAGAHPPPAVEPLGFDSYNYLVEGEKVWFMAPPESADAFRRLFANRAPLDAESTNYDAHLRLGVHAVHQKAGDAVFIPGGWVHASQCLTYTVSFGSSYLRAWKLLRTISSTSGRSHDDVARNVNIDEIFGKLFERNWGVDDEELDAIRTAWAARLSEWDDELELVKHRQQRASHMHM
jgi:hypothetical protein